MTWIGWIILILIYVTIFFFGSSGGNTRFD